MNKGTKIWIAATAILAASTLTFLVLFILSISKKQYFVAKVTKCVDESNNEVTCGYGVQKIECIAVSKRVVQCKDNKTWNWATSEYDVEK